MSFTIETHSRPERAPAENLLSITPGLNTQTPLAYSYIPEVFHFLTFTIFNSYSYGFPIEDYINIYHPENSIKGQFEKIGPGLSHSR